MVVHRRKTTLGSPSMAPWIGCSCLVNLFHKFRIFEVGELSLSILIDRIGACVDKNARLSPENQHLRDEGVE